MNLASEITKYLNTSIGADGGLPYPPIPFSDFAINSLTIQQLRELLPFATNQVEGTWNGKEIKLLLADLPPKASLGSLTETENRELSAWEKKTGYLPSLGQALIAYYRRAFDRLTTKWLGDLAKLDTQQANEKTQRWFQQGFNAEEKRQYWESKQAQWEYEGQQSRLKGKTLADNPYSHPTTKTWWLDGEKFWAKGWNA